MTTFSQQEVEFLQNHGNEVSQAQFFSIVLGFFIAISKSAAVLPLLVLDGVQPF